MTNMDKFQFNMEKLNIEYMEMEMKMFMINIENLSHFIQKNFLHKDQKNVLLLKKNML